MDNGNIYIQSQILAKETSIQPQYSFSANSDCGMACQSGVLYLSSDHNAITLDDNSTISNMPIGINSSDTYDSVITTIQKHSIANVQILNNANNELLGTSTIRYYKVGDLCTVSFSGELTNQLTQAGKLIFNSVVPVEFRPCSNNNCMFAILTSRNADSPIFTYTTFMRYDSTVFKWTIVNDNNGGDIPNGENIIFETISLTYNFE